jgi:hypothetical protein
MDDHDVLLFEHMGGIKGNKTHKEINEELTILLKNEVISRGGAYEDLDAKTINQLKLIVIKLHTTEIPKAPMNADSVGPSPPPKGKVFGKGSTLERTLSLQRRTAERGATTTPPHREPNSLSGAKDSASSDSKTTSPKPQNISPVDTNRHSKAVKSLEEMPKPKIKRSKPMKSKSSMVVRVVAMNKRHTTPDDSTILEENSPWKMKLQNLHYKRTLERQEFSKMATNFQKEIEALKAFHAEEIEKERNNFLFQIETAKIEAVHNYRSKLKGRLSAAQYPRGCSVCNTLFSTFSRQSHCRSCGLLICSNCHNEKCCIICKEEFVGEIGNKGQHERHVTFS